MSEEHPIECYRRDTRMDEMAAAVSELSKDKEELVKVISELCCHIYGTTGARIGSDSHEVVMIAEAALKKHQPEKTKNDTNDEN